jgi:hypothetical protein
MAGMARRGVNYWLIDIPIGRGITNTPIKTYLLLDGIFSIEAINKRFSMKVFYKTQNP